MVKICDNNLSQILSKFVTTLEPDIPVYIDPPCQNLNLQIQQRFVLK